MLQHSFYVQYTQHLSIGHKSFMFGYTISQARKAPKLLDLNADSYEVIEA